MFTNLFQLPLFSFFFLLLLQLSLSFFFLLLQFLSLLLLPLLQSHIFFCFTISNIKYFSIFSNNPFLLFLRFRRIPIFISNILNLSSTIDPFLFLFTFTNIFSTIISYKLNLPIRSNNFYPLFFLFLLFNLSLLLSLYLILLILLIIFGQ